MLKTNSKTPLFTMLVSLLFVSCATPKMNRFKEEGLANSQPQKCTTCQSSSIKFPKTKTKNRWNINLMRVENVDG